MFGKKPKLLDSDVMTMTSYLYCQFDEYTGNTTYYQVADNDSRAILQLLQVTTIPLTQSKLLRLAKIVKTLPRSAPDTMEKLDFKKTLTYTYYDSPILVDWSACKLPENKAEALAPLGDVSKEILSEKGE